MFEGMPKSSPEDGPSPRADIGDMACLRVEHLLEWRDAAKRVERAYTDWCASARRDRRRRYASFVDALEREERAARELDLVTSALGSGDPIA